MRRDDRSANLMFLLSLPFMVTACPGGEDEETGGETEPVDTSTSNETSTTGEPPSTTEGPDTGSTTGESSCTEAPPVMGPSIQACTDYAAKLDECNVGLSPECLMRYEVRCQYYIEYTTMGAGEACGMAYEEVYACISMLACEAFSNGTLDDCEAQRMALDTCVPM